MSIDVFLVKALRIFATYLLVNNSSLEKLVLSFELPTMFDDILKTTSVSCFIDNFSLLSCEFDSFTFKVYYIESFLYVFRLKIILFTILLLFLVKSLE